MNTDILKECPSNFQLPTSNILSVHFKYSNTFFSSKPVNSQKSRMLTYGEGGLLKYFLILIIKREAVLLVISDINATSFAYNTNRSGLFIIAY